MASVALTTPSTNVLSGQPSIDGEQLIIRSSASPDTGVVSLSGVIGGTPDTEDVTLSGKIEVQTVGIFTSLSQVVLSAVQTGIVFVRSQGVAASGLVIVTNQPSNGHQIAIGLTGFVQTYTFKTTLTGAANEVLIGATVSDTANNLSAAINASAGAGTNYGTDTVANAYVIATLSGQIVTITDRIACLRAIVWSVTQPTGATLSIAPPTGGVNGPLLATLVAGVTDVYNPLSFDTEDLTLATLPAKLLPTSDPIFLGGRGCSLRFRCGNVVDSIESKYQTSTDRINWSDGITAIPDLDNNPVVTPVVVVPGELNIEWLRWKITQNNNTSDTALDARVIYG